MFRDQLPLRGSLPDTDPLRGKLRGEFSSDGAKQANLLGKKNSAARIFLKSVYLLEGRFPDWDNKFGMGKCAATRSFLNPNSEVETADDADGADRQKPGDQTSRMIPKHAREVKPV